MRHVNAFLSTFGKDGGMVQTVYADRKVDVDVLDYDNYRASEDGSEEEDFYEDLMIETATLKKAW